MDMGGPELDPRRIPVRLPGEVVLNYPLTVGGVTWRIIAFPWAIPIAWCSWMSRIRWSCRFWAPCWSMRRFSQPDQCGVCQGGPPGSYSHARMGARRGETLACGTGACATLVAAVLTGRADRKATLELTGGRLKWSGLQRTIMCTKPDLPLCVDGVWPDDENRGGCYFAARHDNFQKLPGSYLFAE